MLGGMCRFWQAFAIIYFSIAFFAVYQMPIQYGLWNAFSVSVGGFGSSMIAGYISDKYEKRNLMTKALVAAIMSFNSIFTCMLLFLVTGSFAFSMSMVFVTYLFGEGWLAPTFAMIQTVIDVQYKGAAIGVFQFATAMSGTMALVTVGSIISGLNIDVLTDQRALGYILALNTVLPCIAATFCFYMAGTHYVAQMTQKKIDKHEALEVAASNLIMMSKQNISALIKSRAHYSDISSQHNTVRMTKLKYNDLSFSLNSEDYEPMAAKSYQVAPLPTFGQQSL
jgi:hypothetical protein